MLSDLLDICVIVYLDDILIYSNSHKKYIKHIQVMLNRLSKVCFFLKASKYEFMINKIFFLNFIIDFKEIEMKEI